MSPSEVHAATKRALAAKSALKAAKKDTTLYELLTLVDGIVGYNVQAAVDDKHHIIVAHEVTNLGPVQK